MEQSYWLGRKRASVANARRATSAQARLVHLDLAGRYSVMAAAQQAAVEGDAAYYGRLESGARWLAGQAAGAEERREHLAHADRYLHLRLDAPAEGR